MSQANNKKSEINGVLLIDKPSGCTSHDVVYRVRRAVNQKAVGHAGTLDPMATGLLVVLLGQATKISDYLLNKNKAYQLQAKLGVLTDTLDADGTITKEKSIEGLTEAQIKEAVFKLQGPQLFRVPAFSAVKRDGEALYKKARAGEVVIRPLKEMNFFNFENYSYSEPVVSLEFSCSKGSYVRSWAEMLGEELNDVGSHLVGLRRIVSAPFKSESSIALEAFEKEIKSNPDYFYKKSDSFIPLEHCLENIKTVTISGGDERLLSNGQIPNDLSRRLIPELKQASKTEASVNIKVISGASGHLLSILEARPKNGLKIKRVFNY